MFGIIVLFRRDSLKSKPSSQKKDTEEKKSEQAKAERSRVWESLTALNESLNQQPPTFLCHWSNVSYDIFFLRCGWSTKYSTHLLLP